MANITLPGLPTKIGTIDNAALLHLNESGVDKKVTISDFLAKIAAQYQSFMQAFLLTGNKAAARLALDITRRTTFSNADYSIVATDKVVAQIGTLSAPRTATLPPANTVPAGEELIIVDDSGTVTTTNKITVSRAGSDTIDGATSKDITLPYGILRLVCDGVSKWKITNAFTSYLTPAELKAGTDLVKTPNSATILAALGFSAYFQSAQQTITLGGGLTIAHGLTRSPTLYKAFLICTVGGGQHGYAQNDETPMLDSDLNTAGGGSTISMVPNATNITCCYGSAAIYVLNKSTGVYAAITPASWKLVIRAWA